MKQLFKAKEKVCIGLDIGTQTVKLLKFKFLKQEVELCGFEVQPLGNSDISQALLKIMQAQDGKKVNISVSGPSVVIRNVNFPKMNSDELRQALKFEAQKYIPFSIDEVNLDSYILKADLADNKMMVLLVAVKKDFINRRLKLFENSGVSVNIVDVDSFALINAFHFNHSAADKSIDHKTVALLDIGAGHSNLNIIEDNSPRLSRDINIAGNNFTQKLSDTLGLDFKSAEELKLKADKESQDKIRPSLEAVIANLATEIRISFDYYESQGASSVAKIFLSGGGSLSLGLKDILSSLLDIEVEYWDPLSKISIPEGIDAQKIKALSSRLVIAAGLALRL